MNDDKGTDRICLYGKGYGAVGRCLDGEVKLSESLLTGCQTS